MPLSKPALPPLALIIALLGWMIAAASQSVAGASFRPGQLLIKPRPGASFSSRLRQIHPQHRVLRQFGGGLQLVEIPDGMDIHAAIRAYQASGLVEFAEPNHRLRAAATPDDPFVLNGGQWGLAEIAAPSAWDLLHDATNVIVAVIDSGLRLTHEDIASNLWTNPGETPGDNVDNDQDGYVDDVHGIASYYDDATGQHHLNSALTDDYGHGTHVAGLIGAVGSNGRGGSGVAWRIQLMPLKFINEVGDGEVADAVACIEYAIRHGARIINASWNGYDYSQSLAAAFAAARAAGILVVTASGNENNDNDRVPVYPGNFGLDNIVVVTATARGGSIWREASKGGNVGATTVDLAAPGQDILSTGGAGDLTYTRLSGTSLSTAFVTGAAALVSARFPQLDAAALRNRLLATSDILPALTGKCRSGGRLNLRKALQTNPATDLHFDITPAIPTTITYRAYPLFSPIIVETSADLRTWLPVQTNTFTTPLLAAPTLANDPGPALFYRLKSE